MRYISLALLLIGLGSGGVPAEEQQERVVQPAAAELDTDGLRPFTASYRMTMKGQDWATAIIDLRGAAVQG